MRVRQRPVAGYDSLRVYDDAPLRIPVRKQLLANRPMPMSAPAGGMRAAATGSTSGAVTVVYSGQPEQDANTMTLERLAEVRRQSRYSAQYNPIAKSLRRCFSDHVIGGGIVPRSSVNPKRLGITESQAREFEEAADDFFRDASRFADSTGRQQYVGLQRLIFLSVFDGGDVFPSFPMIARDDGSPVRTRINLIEAERVETPLKETLNPRISGGVQTDPWGAPEGFWVTRDHPGDARATRRFVHEFWPRIRKGRLNVMQAYGQDRIGQARGLPFLWAANPVIDQVAQYVDTTIFHAELQTRLSFWITTNGDPEQMAAMLQMRDSAARQAAYAELLETGIQPDTVNILAEGDDVKSIGPTTPGAYWDALIVRLLRLCGAAAGGVPYELFSNDVGAANYSSIRAALMSFRKTVAQQHEVLIPVFAAHRELAIWEGWLDGKILPGAPWLRMADDRAGWLACKWHLPSHGWIDPTKEVSAFIQARDAGFMSTGDVIAMTTGETYADVARRRAAESRIDQELGLSSPSKTVVAVSSTVAPDPAAAPVDGADPQDPAQSDSEVADPQLQEAAP